MNGNPSILYTKQQLKMNTDANMPRNEEGQFIYFHSARHPASQAVTLVDKPMPFIHHKPVWMSVSVRLQWAGICYVYYALAFCPSMFSYLYCKSMPVYNKLRFFWIILVTGYSKCVVYFGFKWQHWTRIFLINPTTTLKQNHAI